MAFKRQTMIEYAVEFFENNPGRVFTLEELAKEFWDLDLDESLKINIPVLMCAARKKVKPGFVLKGLREKGYVYRRETEQEHAERVCKKTLRAN